MTEPKIGDLKSTISPRDGFRKWRWEMRECKSYSSEAYFISVCSQHSNRLHTKREDWESSFVFRCDCVTEIRRVYNWEPIWHGSGYARTKEAAQNQINAIKRSRAQIILAKEREKRAQIEADQRKKELKEQKARFIKDNTTEEIISMDDILDAK